MIHKEVQGRLMKSIIWGNIFFSLWKIGMFKDFSIKIKIFINRNIKICRDTAYIIQKNLKNLLLLYYLQYIGIINQSKTI